MIEESTESIVIEVWDLPLRLFHWLLGVSVVGAYVTGTTLFGAFILGLLIFRILWGFVATTHARFVNFFPTRAHLAAGYDVIAEATC